jgi:hypothetical protein
VPDPSLVPLVGPVPLDTNISLAIGLPVRNPGGLSTFIQQVSDPKSSSFRQFLTQAQFAATYGATCQVTTYDRVEGRLGDVPDKSVGVKSTAEN